MFNLNNPYEPDIHVQEGQSKMAGEICSIAWNNKVHNIMSSTATNGVTVVWDLKKAIVCAQLEDPSHRTVVSSVAWSPTQPTQLMIAFDDDRLPGIQLWDLRSAKYPVKEIKEAHSKGIKCVAWHPTDPELLLSSGADNRVCCWVLGLYDRAHAVGITEPELLCEVGGTSSSIGKKFFTCMCCSDIFLFACCPSRAILCTVLCTCDQNGFFSSWSNTDITLQLNTISSQPNLRSPTPKTRPSSGRPPSPVAFWSHPRPAESLSSRA